MDEELNIKNLARDFDVPKKKLIKLAESANVQLNRYSSKHITVSESDWKILLSILLKNNRETYRNQKARNVERGKRSRKINQIFKNIDSELTDLLLESLEIHLQDEDFPLIIESISKGKVVKGPNNQSILDELKKYKDCVESMELKRKQRSEARKNRKAKIGQILFSKRFFCKLYKKKIGIKFSFTRS